MEIKIERAKPSDNLEILRLERKVWKKDFNLKDVSGKYDLGSFIKIGKVFVAKDKSKNKIIGAIISLRTEKGETFITDWVVDEKYRNRGIGTRLYNKLKSSEKNHPLITFVETRYGESIKIHKKMGFKIKKKVRDIYRIGERKDYYIFYKNN